MASAARVLALVELKLAKLPVDDLAALKLKMTELEDFVAHHAERVMKRIQRAQPAGSDNGNSASPVEAAPQVPEWQRALMVRRGR